MKIYMVMPVAICVMSACCAFLVGSRNLTAGRKKFAYWQLSLGAVLSVEAIGIMIASVFV